MNRNYGWIKQKKDPRDFQFRVYKAFREVPSILPLTASNQSFCSPVLDQQTLGACTSFAWSGLCEYNEIKFNNLTGSSFTPLSQLFIYWNERALDNNTGTDSGAALRDGATTLSTQGVCPESEWGYDVNQYTVQPTPQCYNDALPNVIHSYYSLSSSNDLKTCIASGQNFVFGFDVYQSFESDEMASTGILQMPTEKELADGPIGGHAVMCCDYSDITQQYLIKNSWGSSWALNGYFYMPYKYMAAYASDFWTIIHDY